MERGFLHVGDPEVVAAAVVGDVPNMKTISTALGVINKMHRAIRNILGNMKNIRDAIRNIGSSRP